MDWLLVILLLDGGVSTVPFNNELSCLSATIRLDLVAMKTARKYPDYRPHAAAFCVPRGLEE